jgi:hypothetical protein
VQVCPKGVRAGCSQDWGIGTLVPPAEFSVRNERITGRKIAPFPSTRIGGEDGRQNPHPSRPLEPRAAILAHRSVLTDARLQSISCGATWDKFRDGWQEPGLALILFT